MEHLRPFVVCICIGLTFGKHLLPTEKPEFGPRIYNGNNAEPGQFPWQVSISAIKGVVFCGGSLISDQWVLTAKHCLNYTKVVVGLGAIHWKASLVSFVTGNYTKNEGGDIAAIRLPQPVIFNANIKPITLASSLVPLGTVMTVAGWGLLWPGGPIPDLLQYTTMKLVKSRNNDLATLRTRSIGDQESTVCSGDSGGPLVFYSDSSPVLMGIVIRGPIRCDEGDTVTYVSIPFYREWIKQTTGV